MIWIGSARDQEGFHEGRSPDRPNDEVASRIAVRSGRRWRRRNNNVAFDMYGVPSISVPCGFTNSGLPIGLQISGAHFAETNVLALARVYEQATDGTSEIRNSRMIRQSCGSDSGGPPTFPS